MNYRGKFKEVNLLIDRLNDCLGVDDYSEVEYYLSDWIRLKKLAIKGGKA